MTEIEEIEKTDSNMIRFAVSEMKRAEIDKSDADYGGEIYRTVLKAIKSIVEDGPSGGSLYMTMEIVNRLASFKPLSPLTGEDDEWMDIAAEHGGNILFQNKRYGCVFKDEKGKAWDIDYYSIICEDGFRTTEREFIEFPYMPRTNPIQKIRADSNPEMAIKRLFDHFEIPYSYVSDTDLQISIQSEGFQKLLSSLRDDVVTGILSADFRNPSESAESAQKSSDSGQNRGTVSQAD